MNNKQTIIDGINKSNLSDEEKSELISILNRGSKAKFALAFLRIVGVSMELFELLDLDIGDLIDLFQ